MRVREMQGYQRGDAHGMDHTGLQAFAQHGGGGELPVGQSMPQPLISGGRYNGPTMPAGSGDSKGGDGQIPGMGGVIAPIERSVSPHNVVLNRGTNQPDQGGYNYAKSKLDETRASVSRMKEPTYRATQEQNVSMREASLNNEYQPVTRVGVNGPKLPGEPDLFKDIPAGQASNPQYPSLSTSQVNNIGNPMMQRHNEYYAAQSKNAISPGQIVPNGQPKLAGQFNASDLDQGQMASLSNTMQAIGPNASNYTAAQEAVKPRLGYDRQMAPKVGGGGRR